MELVKDKNSDGRWDDSLEGESQIDDISSAILPKVTNLVEISEIEVRRHFDKLAKVGNLGSAMEDGFLRKSWSPEETEALEHFRVEGDKLGFQTEYDSVGNLYITLPGISNTVVQSGSHLDTVVGGGNYDGSAGVVAGFESLKAIHKLGFPLRHGLQLAVWRGEESATYGEAYKGSRAAFGENNPDILKKTFQGQSLKKAISSCQNPITKEKLDPHCIERQTPALSQDKIDSIAAYVELHIEQGKILERNKQKVGLVKNIRGARRAKFNISSDSDLELAELMVRLDKACWREIDSNKDLVQTFGMINLGSNGFYRRSAFNSCNRTSVSGYSEILLPVGYRRIEPLVKKIASEQKVQIEHQKYRGFIKLKIKGKFDHSGATPMGPGWRQDANLAAAYIIQGVKNRIGCSEAFLNREKGADIVVEIDIRSTDPALLNRYFEYVTREFSRIGRLAGKTGCDPVERLDLYILNKLSEAAILRGHREFTITSGAGHDAALLSSIVRSNGKRIRTGMLFIPCKDGLSHSPLEFVENSIVAEGANVLAATLLSLATDPLIS